MSKFEEAIEKLPLDKEVVDSLKESWESALAEAKIVAGNEARKEVMDKYKSDLAKIENAVGKFIAEAVAEHMKELTGDIQSIAEKRKELLEKAEEFRKMKRYELRESRLAVEKAVEGMVKEHVAELAEDVKAHRAAAMQVIKEAKDDYARKVERLKEKSAKVLEFIIEDRVEKNIKELREDIEEARKNRFGQELFEAFYDTFRHQFFDTNTEFKKLAERNERIKAKSEEAINRAKQLVLESRRETAKIKKEAAQLVEAAKRKELITELLQPLPADVRATIRPVLEHTEYSKIKPTFEKMINEGAVGYKPVKNVRPAKPAKPGKLVESRHTPSAPARRVASHKPKKILVETSDYGVSPKKRHEDDADKSLFTELRLRSGIGK